MKHSFFVFLLALISLFSVACSSDGGGGNGGNGGGGGYELLPGSPFPDPSTVVGAPNQYRAVFRMRGYFPTDATAIDEYHRTLDDEGWTYDADDKDFSLPLIIDGNSYDLTVQLLKAEPPLGIFRILQVIAHNIPSETLFSESVFDDAFPTASGEIRQNGVGIRYNFPDDSARNAYKNTYIRALVNIGFERAEGGIGAVIYRKKIGNDSASVTITDDVSWPFDINMSYSRPQ